MTPESVLNGSITSTEVELFRKMRGAVERMPDVAWGGVLLSCHHVCHALATVFEEVMAVDGIFGKSMEHGWLVLRETRRDGPVIADMYPIAGASPFLVHAYWVTPWAKLYQPRLETIAEVQSRDLNFGQHVMWVANRLRLVLN